MSSRAPSSPALTRDSYQILQELRQTKLEADFYISGLQHNLNVIKEKSIHPNLRDEEQKLLSEYQDYMDGIRLQQDKILRSVTYP